MTARSAAALVDTVVWGWHHPGALGVLALCSVAFGAFCYVSARSHRPRNQER